MARQLEIESLARASSSDYLRRVFLGLMAGIIVSIVIAAGVWALAVWFPSKASVSDIAPAALIERIYRSQSSTAIRESLWVFPIIEGTHLLELAPWVLVSLLIILASGLLLFSSEALKAYASVPFQVKIILLFAATIFHYTIYGKVIYADEHRISPTWNKLAAAVSLALWFGVGLGGRAIGFL